MTDFTQYRAYQCRLCGDNCINHLEAPRSGEDLCLSCYSLSPAERAERARERQFEGWFKNARMES